MTNQHKNICSAIAKGAAWMVALRLSLRFLGLISTLILVRILEPEDFAIIALATTVLGVLTTMSEFRLDSALIQNQKSTPIHYDAAWTMGFMRAVLVAAIITVGAPWVAAFFHEPRITQVLYVLAFTAFLDGAQSVRVVDFRKELEFDKEFKFLVAPKIVSFLLTISFALILRSYWALVIGIFGGRLTQTLVSHVVAPYKPRFTLQYAKEILSFSGWLWLTTVVGYLARRIDQLMIARYVNSRMLGIYNVAHEIASLPTTELVWPIARALFPGYSKVSNDRQKLRDLFLDTVYVVCLIGFPMAAGLALTALPAVHVVLGEKWLETVPLIQIIVVAGAIDFIVSGLPVVFMAIGRSKLTFFHSLLVGSIKIGLILIGVYYYGGTGAAWALVAGAVVSVLVGLNMAYFFVALSPLAFIAKVVLPFVCVTFMSLAVIAIQTVLESQGVANDGLYMLSASILVGILTYVVIVYLAWIARNKPDGIEKNVFEKLRRAVVSRL